MRESKPTWHSINEASLHEIQEIQTRHVISNLQALADNRAKEIAARRRRSNGKWVAAGIFSMDCCAADWECVRIDALKSKQELAIHLQIIVIADTVR